MSMNTVEVVRKTVVEDTSAVVTLSHVLISISAVCVHNNIIQSLLIMSSQLYFATYTFNQCVHTCVCTYLPPHLLSKISLELILYFVVFDRMIR